MKHSLRLRLLLLLAASLTAAFSLVYLAISTYTDVAFERMERRSARRSLSALILEHARALPIQAAPSVTEQDWGGSSCWKPEATTPALAESVTASGGDTKPRAQRNSGAAEQSPLVQELQRACQTALAGSNVGAVDPHSVANAATQPLQNASAKFTLRNTTYYAACSLQHAEICGIALTPLASAAPALSHLSLLYLALIAGTLLIGVYFALTYWVVSPLGQIVGAAQRVTLGSRTLALPNFGVSELQNLAQNISAMTQRLVSEQAQLSEKVLELTLAREQLVSAQNQLVRSERLASVGQLSAGLAHEIGNPLTSIQGLLDLLIQGPLGREEELDFLRRIRRETDRIYRILRDLLQFARPSSVSVQNSASSVQSALSETLALLAPQNAFREVNITTQIDPLLPQVQFAAEHLQQVLLNLLLNAAAACQTSGEIHIAARQNGSDVEVSVRDDGPGVAAELRDRIFEPFVTTKDVGQGTGLGLSVCRGLVEAAGGTLLLDPDSGSGARFVILLPSSQPLA